MKAKKKRSPLLIIIIILFGIYASLYYLAESGYYDYKEYNKMIMTEEAMKQFENDVAAGKDITLNDYLNTEFKDYSNNVSKLGLKTSETLENFVTKGIGGFFKVFSKLVT